MNPNFKTLEEWIESERLINKPEIARKWERKAAGFYAATIHGVRVCVVKTALGWQASGGGRVAWAQGNTLTEAKETAEKIALLINAGLKEEGR